MRASLERLPVCNDNNKSIGYALIGLGQNISKNLLKLVVFLNTTKKSSKYNKNILRYITEPHSAPSQRTKMVFLQK